ncbi:MAG: hypothetical protein HON94_10355 [Methylococcales bacterium]|nr:hypothetical protein [Methylococcales bacterium]MBT7410741.1 hypothetical protein [Methylococcales bacterium]
MQIPFKKKSTNNLGQLGVGFHPNGISFAHVISKKNERPILTFCDFQPAHNLEEQENILNQYVIKNHWKDVPCVNVLHPDTYNLLQLEVPDVDPDELKEAIRWKIKDLVDFDVESAIIDLFEIPEPHQRKDKNLHYAVATNSVDIKPLVDVILESGLKLKAIDIFELSLRNVAKMLPDCELGLSLIYLDNKEGYLQIFNEQIMYLTRKLDLGINTFMESGDFSVEGKVVKISPELQSTMDTLILELQRSMDFYESHFVQAPVGSIVIAPTEEPIPYLPPYTGKQLGVKCCQLDLNRLFVCEEKIPAVIQARCLPAVGAALRQDVSE